ncbi:hypothetical protein CPB83DRAFT_926245 [Crepidotus variabilis]|uniref:Uncharacterized protein n=1 Tax=Crepidotus variabilis TaxID=179855 RepID=A0A9P6E2W6_9AGAR|nr:hypothetical protein CPB83DRAFT_926245 [Crepidotus variabilis]
MAKLSWIIAIALASDKEDPLTDCPQWMSYLLERSQPEPLLVHSIRSSAATFSEYEPFVGVFVDLLEFNPSHPSIQFLIRNRVPVWYRWGSAEEMEARSSPYLRRYAPLLEQYQQASTTLMANPTPPRPDHISSPYRPDYTDALPEIEDAPASLAPKEGPSSIQKTPDEPWVEVFARRELKKVELLPLQSHRDTQACRDREKNPPRTRTTIWEWEVEDGWFVRKQVEKRMFSSMFEYYGSNQSRYDAFFNVWDFCSAWGEKTTKEIEADEEEDEAEAMADAYIAQRDAALSSKLWSTPLMAPLESLASTASEPTSSPLIANPAFSSASTPLIAPSLAAPVLVSPSAAVLHAVADPTWVPNPETTHQDGQTAFDWDPRHLTDDLFDYFGFLLPQPLPLTVPMSTEINGKDFYLGAYAEFHASLSIA